MNYYEILGVDRGAEQEVIAAVFRATMRRYPPATKPETRQTPSAAPSN